MKHFWRKVLSIVLCLLIVMSSIPFQPIIAEAATVTSDYTWYGDGSATSFTLSTAGQLQALANLVNGTDGKTATTFTGKTVTLATNIELTGLEWLPIGDNRTGTSNFPDSGPMFNGTFDGGNYSITGLSVNISEPSTNVTTYGGFFGVVGSNATIKNLIIQEPTVKVVGGKSNGGISSADGGAFSGGVAGTSAGIIENCHVTGGAITVACNSNGSSDVGAGGIVGQNAGGTVSKCSSLSNVSTVETSLEQSKIPPSYIGGIAGRNEGTISNCYAVGNLKNNIPVGTSYAKSLTAGIVGLNNGSSTSISNCHFSGAVAGNKLYASSKLQVAGIMGLTETSGGVSNCYYNTGTVPSSTNTKGTGLTAAEMLLSTSFSGWDFTGIWEMGSSYPVLRVVNVTPPVINDCKCTVGAFSITSSAIVVIPYGQTSTTYQLAHTTPTVDHNGCIVDGHNVDGTIKFSYFIEQNDLPTDGASIDSVTKLMTFSKAGTYEVSVIAIDSISLKESHQSITITVTDEKCDCVIPGFTVANQTTQIPYGKTSGQYIFIDPVLTLGGDCTQPGHSATQIEYTYEVESKDAGITSATFTGNILTATGEGKVTVKITATAPNTGATPVTSSSEITFTTEKCECTISDFTFNAGALIIPYGQSNAEKIFTDPTDAILKPCSAKDHDKGIVEFKYEIVADSNTANASIIGKKLTAINEGSFSVKITASVPGIGVSKEKIALFNVTKEELTVQDSFKNIQIISGKDATLGWDANFSRQISINVKNSTGITVHTASVNAADRICKIPAAVLTGIKNYTAEIIVKEGIPSVNVGIKIVPPQTSLLFDTAPNVYYDSVGTVKLTWQTKNELSGSNRKVTVKCGNTEYTNVTTSGDSVVINGIKKPTSNIDTYTVNVSSSFDGTDLAAGSFTFSIYKTNGLQIINTLDNTLLTESKPLVISNETLAASMDSTQLLAKANSFNLQRTIKLKQAFSTYGEDKYQWTVADSQVATIEGTSGVKDTYSSAETMMLTGLRTGETIVTVKHVSTGETASFKVTVSTLSGKLFVLQTSVKAAVKLNYTSNGQAKAVIANTNGMAAIYELNGITGNVTVSGSGTGEIYMGSSNVSNLTSGEATRNGGTYPINKINAVAATKITLQLSAASGSLNTKAALTIKGFLLKNGAVVDTQAINCTPKSYSYEKVTLNFDTTKLGSLSSADSVKFVYEIIGGGYAPAYASVDAASSGNANFGTIKTKLQKAQTTQSVYLNSLLLSTPSSGSIEDVSARTAYVTIDKNSQTRYLKALVCWPKGQVGVPTIVNAKGDVIGASSITYTNLSLPDMNYGWQEVVIKLDSNLVKAGESLKFSYSFYNTSIRTTTKIPVSFTVSNITGIAAAEKINSVPFSGNVSTGSTGLKILGNKSFNFELPNGLKAVMDYDFSGDPLNGTFQMLIGYNYKMPEDEDADYAGAISDVKELMAQGSKALGGGGFSYGFKVVGFMMGNVSYRNADWVLIPTGGGILGAAEIGYSYSQTAVIGIIPVNYGVELKAGVEATLIIDSTTVTGGVTKENFSEMFDFYLKIYGSVYAYGGIGFDLKIVAARIGIFGQLGLEYYFRTAVIEKVRKAGGQLKLTGSIGIEAVVKFLWWKKRYVLCEAGFEKKFNPNGFDFTKYGGFVRPDLPGMKKMMAFRGSDGTEYEVYEGGYEIEDRDYLSEPQVWNGGVDTKLRLFSMTANTPAIKDIANNVYPYADPMLSSDANLMVMLSDFASIDVNKTGAAYSTKKDGTWSAPIRIYSAETPASNLAFDGTATFAAAAWESVENPVVYDETKEISNVDVAATMGSSEIYASVYNGTSFITTQITKNSEADMIPEISANGNKAIVVWQRVATSPEDPTKIEGKNEILYSIFNGTDWTSEKILDTGDAGAVKSFSTAMASDGNAVVTLSIDTDGNNSTYPDMEVFNYFINANGTTSSRIAISSNTSTDSNPQVVARKLNVNGTEKEYFLTGWYNEVLGADGEQSLRSVLLDARELNGNKADGFASSFGTAGGNFSFIKATDSNINTVGIVWSEAISQGTYTRQTIYAKLLTDGIDGMTTTPSFEITSGDPTSGELCEIETVAKKDLDSVTLNSMYVRKNIKIDTGNEAIPKTGDAAILETTSTDIMTAQNTIIDTAEIIDVSADASKAQLQSILPVRISVKNNGFTKITGFKAEANGQSFTFNSILLPGQTTELNIDYLVTNFDDIKIKVTPLYSGGVEGSPLVNTIKLLAPDLRILSVIQTEIGDGGKRVFDVSLSNTGTKALANTGYKVKVSVFEDFGRTIPAKTTDLATGITQTSGEIEISDNDNLKETDEGKGILRIGYTINSSSYNSLGNKTLYVSVSIVDAEGNTIEDFNSINNEGGITFVSPEVLYPSQFEVTVVQNNSDGVTNADLTVRNLYQKSGKDTLRLRLLDGNTIVEEKTIVIEMDPESTMKQSIKFTKSGTAVAAAFGADLIAPTPTPTPTPTTPTSTPTPVPVPAPVGETVVKETGADGTVEVKATDLAKATSLTIKSDVIIDFDATSTKSLAKIGDFTVSIKKADILALNSELANRIGERPVFNLTVTSQGKNITGFDGGYVNVSVPYTIKTGESPEAILVYYIDGNGMAIPTYSKYDSESKTVRFTTNHLSTYAVAYNKASFSDVSGWAESYITYLAARNIISGVGDDKFAPKDQVTRAQFTRMLFGISGLNQSVLEDYKVTGFDDVSAKDWYAPYVMWANKNGIVSGVGNNKFNPNANITREQMAVMLYNFIKLSGVNLTHDTATQDFKDDAIISSWAKEAVKFTKSASLISGNGNGIFNPAGTATRAEAATVVAVFIQSLFK